MPIFFLGVVLFLLFVFSAFFQILSPPPPSHGICCFSEHLADSDLHCNYCAPLPSHGNLTKASTRRQGDSKLIARNKVFDCTTLLKIEVIEYGKWFSKWLEMHTQRQRFE